MNDPNEQRPDPHALSALEALHSTPARRYLSTQPISENIIRALLDAAVRGPSGGNSQHWAWIVVTDAEIKQRIAGWYRQAWQAAYGGQRDAFLTAQPSDTGLSPTAYRGAEHLAEHLEEAPAWIIPVLRGGSGSTDPRLGSSIYGAIQNLQLAARAYGIGSSLTTLHTLHEAEVHELLGLPEDAITMALIPLGYPDRGKWTEPRRAPLEEVVHRNRWGGATG